MPDKTKMTENKIYHIYFSELITGKCFDQVKTVSTRNMCLTEVTLFCIQPPTQTI